MTAPDRRRASDASKPERRPARPPRRKPPLPAAESDQSERAAAAAFRGLVTVRDVAELQRSMGNEATRRLLQRLTDTTVQRGGPDDIHAAVAAAKQADDPMAVIRAMDRPDFGQATDEERITCIRIVLSKGGGDAQRLGRLWNSFPEARLPEVAMKYVTDWEATAKAWPGVPDLVTAVPKAVEAFRARLRSEAEANLADNAAYVKQRMDQLGYGSAAATMSAGEQTELRRKMQATAYHLSTLRKTQEKAKRIPIGRTVGRVSLPVTFDPAGPNVHDGPKSVDQAKWEAIKREWDDAQKPIATAAANHPELYELLARPNSEQALLDFSRITAEAPGNRPGTSDGAAPGQGYQTQAKNLLTDLLKRIEGARRDLAGLDMLDLPTLHARVYEAAGPYKSGFGQWVAKRAVERHVRDAHTMKVLAQMGEGGALLVGTIATGGLALAVTAVGTGAGVAHAAVDYAEAGKLQNLARSTPKKGTELISQAEADAKMTEAGAEVFAAAIAVIAAAGVAWAAAVEARLAGTLEKLVADKAVREALLLKVGDKRTLIKLLEKAESPTELKVLLEAVDAAKAGHLLELRKLVRQRIGAVRRTYGTALQTDQALEKELAEAEDLLKNPQKAEEAAQKVDAVVNKALAPLRALVTDEALLQQLLMKAGSPDRLMRWLRSHKTLEELTTALDAIWQKVPDGAQRSRLLDIVERPGSLAKYLDRVADATELEAKIAATRASGVPGGVDPAKWKDIAARVKAQAAPWGGQPMVQGSRAAGVAEAASDLDFALLMDAETYDAALVKAYKTTPKRIAEMRAIPEANYKEMVPSKERGLWYSANKGKIARGELKLSGLGKAIEKELGLAKDVDLSAIRKGGDLDQGPYLPL